MFQGLGRDDFLIVVLSERALFFQTCEPPFFSNYCPGPGLYIQMNEVFQNIFCDLTARAIWFTVS